MNEKETLRISPAPVATSPSLDGNLSKWNVSPFLKGTTPSTDVNLFPGTEYLVIDGEWRRFNVVNIISCLHF